MTQFITFKKKKTLPSRDELAFFMWKKSCDYSHISNSFSINRLTFLSLSWNIWVDKAELQGRILEQESIDFFISKNKKNYNIKIYLQNNASMFNVRAFHRAVYFLAAKTKGDIGGNHGSTCNYREYYKVHRKLISMNLNLSIDA